MEFNLLKTIESNIGTPFIPSQPLMSPYPAFDHVNPGVGQINRLFSFYVPLYSNANLHSLKKKVDFPEGNKLEGFGNIEENKTDSNEEDQSNQDDPIQFNELKRKQMGSAIQESFMHPKIIKTNTIHFEVPNKQKSTKTEKETKISKVKSDQKHKFQIF